MSGGEIVLTDILARYLKALEPMSDGDLQCEDPTAKSNKMVWKLITPQIWLKNHHYDELSKVLDGAVEHARARACNAEHVTEAWNKAGLLSEDELTTDDEQGEFTTGTNNGSGDASNVLQQQVVEYQRRISQLEVLFYF